MFICLGFLELWVQVLRLTFGSLNIKMLRILSFEHSLTSSIVCCKSFRNCAVVSFGTLLYAFLLLQINLQLCGHSLAYALKS